MVESQDLVFGVLERACVLDGFADHQGVLVGHATGQRQNPHVVQQADEEGVFGGLRGHAFGDQARGNRGREGIFPELRVIELILREGSGMLDQGEAEGQVLDRIEAQHVDGVEDRSHLAGQGVDGGIDQAQNLGAEGGIRGQDFADFLQIRTLLLDHLEDFQGDTGQGRQLALAAKNAFQNIAFVH